MSDLTKATLVKKLAEKMGCSQVKAAESLDAVFEVISETVKEQGQCRLAGFGRFFLRPVKEKVIKPQGITGGGADVVVPAHTKFVFKAAKPIKERFVHVEVSSAVSSKDQKAHVVPVKKETATKKAPKKS